MKINKQEELEKKYNFKGNYIKDFKIFRDEITQKKIIPYQVEFQAPPRGKKICWLECPYCYGLSADNNGERLSKERGLEILKQILDGGVKKIIFAGYATDPLNCSYIGELLDLTISNKAVFGFNTKALKISDTFFNALKNNKISDSSYISLSVDAGSNETYNPVIKDNKGVEYEKSNLVTKIKHVRDNLEVKQTTYDQAVTNFNHTNVVYEEIKSNDCKASR
jgi:sulfatase maturation enzyme AslB (radical SAM superfamily)